MIAVYKGYKGEVVNIAGNNLFYTLDPSALGYLWRNLDRYIPIDIVPREAYCWWLDSKDDAAVTYYNGRRRMI